MTEEVLGKPRTPSVGVSTYFGSPEAFDNFLTKTAHVRTLCFRGQAFQLETVTCRGTGR